MTQRQLRERAAVATGGLTRASVQLLSGGEWASVGWTGGHALDAVQPFIAEFTARPLDEVLVIVCVKRIAE